VTPFVPWTDTLPTLQGPRVQLRALEDDDAPALLSIFGDPEVVKYWSSPELRNLAAAKELLGEIREKINARRLLQWGVAARDTGEVIGTGGLSNVLLPHRRAEVGFALRRDRWGQGLAAEALRLLFEFSFRTLGLHRIEADVDPRNERSLRVLERQGFRREGYLRERWHHLGEVHDGVFLGLLQREWLAGNAAEPRVAADRAAPGR
jgi:[ribosomal protein S5]-alanine N-acetyltransferase